MNTHQLIVVHNSQVNQKQTMVELSLSRIVSFTKLLDGNGAISSSMVKMTMKARRRIGERIV